MTRRTRSIAVAAGLAIAGALGVATAVFAYPAGQTAGRGGGMCGGPGVGGMGPGGGHGGDMMGIHALFAHRDQIRRTVTQIPGGVRTTTESDDPAVVAQLRD